MSQTSGVGPFVNPFTRWDRWEQAVDGKEAQLRSSARGHRPAHRWIHGTPLYVPSPGPHKMAFTAPTIDVKAITALVIEGLRNDVAAAAAGGRSDSPEGQEPERKRAQPSGPATDIGARQRQGPHEREQQSGVETTGRPTAEPGSRRVFGEARDGDRERPARDDSGAAGTIRDLRLEIAALRKHEPAKEKAAPAAQRQRETWPTGGGNRDAMERTRLAQPTTRPTYAEAAQASSRRTRMQTKVIAMKEVPTTGIPLQPVAVELQRTAEKGGYGVVLLARPYRDKDLTDTGMVQQAPAALPSQLPPTLKNVLLVSKSTEDAWAAASEAPTTHKGLQD